MPQPKPMPTANSDRPRRSSRVQVNIPILVTRVEGGHFSDVCETMVLNAHGCAVRSAVPLDAGAPLHVQLKSGRHTTAQVLNCERLDSGQQAWRLGVSLDRPGNFWGLDPCPEDWSQPGHKTAAEKPATGPGANGAAEAGQSKNEPAVSSPEAVISAPAPAAPRAKAGKADPSHDRLRAVVGEMVRPLQQELAELKGRVRGGGAKGGSFEISLSHIPEEVEEKLRQQLHEQLGAEVLRQTRQQAEEILHSIDGSIQQKVEEMQRQFREQAAGELRAVEQKAQAATQEITSQSQERMRAELAQFEQKSSAAGARIEGRSEELLRQLEQRLSADYEAQRREMQAAHDAVGAESARLREQIGELDERMARVHETVSRTESDLEGRLQRLTKEAVAAARTQLESAVEAILHELGQRNARELDLQLEQAVQRVKSIGSESERSTSEWLKKETGENLQSFEQTIEEMAQHSVEHWRLALARDLEAAFRVLTGQLQVEKTAGRDDD
jgi:hypothetical protein